MVIIMVVEDKTGRERKERLRARRDEAGLAQVSGWVPKERRAYARKVLAAIAQGTNSLPPDPEQAAVLEAAEAETAAARAGEKLARAALTLAEQREQTLAAELEATRATVEAVQQAGCQVEAVAVARAKEADQAREDVLNQLQVVKAVAAQALVEAGRLRQAPGLRGRVARWLVR